MIRGWKGHELNHLESNVSWFWFHDFRRLNCLLICLIFGPQNPLRNEGFFQAPEKNLLQSLKRGVGCSHGMYIDRIFRQFSHQDHQTSFGFPCDSWRREKGWMTQKWRWGFHQNDARPLRVQWILRVEFCALDFAPIFFRGWTVELALYCFFSHLYNWGNSTCGYLW